MRMQLVPSADSAGFLDLPWSVPLEEWPEDLLVHAARGIGRHVVRFVDCGGTLYALKELPSPLAEREYRFLREMAVEGVPAVDAVGAVRDRAPGHARDVLADVVITRYLEFALPLRLVIARRPLPDLLDRLLDAFVELLVRLHLAGFFWGDCSLSNTLFRRDAGALAAFLVDAETCERHPQLTTGQRHYDLDIATQNVYGELLDLEAELGDDGGRDPDVVIEEIRVRYERLWGELTAEETFAPGERHRLEDRLRRLNELGFDVEEIELVASDEGYRLRLEPSVVEPGHHRRRLLRLTGLVAQENQARRLLNDITSYRVALEQAGDRFVSEAAAAGRWLAEIFEPAVAAVPVELRGKRAAAELFHELLDYRWRLSEESGRDVSLDEAIRSYVDTVLREATDEKAVVSELRPWTGP
jgi:Domain of unknown function (DUF4032)/Lipopolysaccharide kinase (Kdo/WaaP) family